MLHFEGDQDFTQAPAEVWSRLSDARFLLKSIPGVESVKQSDAKAFVCVLRPGFSFVRGTLEVSLNIVDAVEPSSIRVKAHGKGIGSGNDVETALSLAPHEGGTRVHWVADVTNLTGLIKAVPQGLLKAAAQKVIGDVWTEVAKQIAAS